MFLEDRPLCSALLISIMLHMLIFLPFPYIKELSIHKSVSALKINYLVAQDSSSAEKVVKKKQNKIIKDQAKSEAKTEYSLRPENIPLKKEEDVSKTATQHAEIEIPPELPKEKEMLYISYYQSIREKIRRSVVKNYPRFIGCGEVCLYFILTADGELKEIKVVEKRSSSNQTLKRIAKESLIQAAPFVAFPKDLDQSQLSFNVIISFELED